jgi:hypothetical protein
MADLTGFEPATSGLTGRRALQAAPQVPVLEHLRCPARRAYWLAGRSADGDAWTSTHPDHARMGLWLPRPLSPILSVTDLPEQERSERSLSCR